MPQTDNSANKRKKSASGNSRAVQPRAGGGSGSRPASGSKSGAGSRSVQAGNARSNSGANSRSKASASKNSGAKGNADKRDRGGDPSMMRHQLAPYILGLVALFLVICFVISDSTGFVGGVLKKLLFGLFSTAAWAVPFLLVNLGIFWKRDVAAGALRYKIAFTSTVLVLISVLINTFSHSVDSINVKELWLAGIEGQGGGVIGGLIGNLLLRGFGFAGTLIFTIALILLFGIFLFGMTPHMFIVYIADGIREWRSGLKDQMEASKIQREQMQIELDQRKIAKRQAALRMREQQLRQRAAQVQPRRRPTVNDALDEDFEPAGNDSANADFGSAVDLDALSIDNRAKNQAADDENLPINNIDENHGGIRADENDPDVVESDAPPFNVIGDKPDVRDGDAAASKPKKESKKSIFAPEEPEEIDLSKIFADPEPEHEPIPVESIAAKPENEEPSDIPTSAEIDLVIEKSKLSPEPMPEPVIDDDDDIDEADDDDAPPFDTDIAVNSSRSGATIEAVKPSATSDYVFPPAALLSYDPSPRTADMSGEIQQTAVKLVETLRSFNVKTKIINVSRGPTVTRYELQPEVGTKVRSILNLVDDIALHLATSGVRIEAPIPGKEAVGIEVPNKTQSTVYIRELIEDDGFKNAASRVTTCLGEDVGGNPVFLDIAKMPHLLIAGTTGSGKSVCINSLIISILYKAKPDEVKFILIDPKKVELNPYNGIPHLLVPVVSDPKKAAGSLHWAVTEMERRYELIEGANVRNLKGYNKSIENDPTAEKLPLIVIVIDELADLMMMAKDDVEDSIIRIAQKARAAGIHLIIGTQRPSVDVITGLIKANVPSRIAFTTMSQVDSRTIIDTAGAEKLIGRGDMLYAPIGAMKPTRVQGSFVSDDEVEAITEFIKNNYGVKDYDHSVMDSIEREAQLCGNKKSTVLGDGDEEANDGDPMLKPAIQLAVESGKISTSLIQRRLQLGYGRAAKLIDTMENMGIVGPPQGQKPRDVLISKQEYMEMELRKSE